MQRHFSCQPVTRSKYTAVCQHAPHYIIRFYTILQFYIRIHFFRQPVTRARKHFPLQNMFQTHIRVETFPFLLPQGKVQVQVQVQIQGYGYGPISHLPAISINHSTLLHKLLLIFISTFFAITITIMKMGECKTIHILLKYYTLTKVGQCWLLLFRIPNVRFL